MMRQANDRAKQMQDEYVNKIRTKYQEKHEKLRLNLQNDWENKNKSIKNYLFNVK